MEKMVSEMERKEVKRSVRLAMTKLKTVITGQAVLLGRHIERKHMNWEGKKK